ncbi:MAG: hypothetical protein ABIR84_05530, partial [Candidatus Nitrotoga sp.]
HGHIITVFNAKWNYIHFCHASTACKTTKSSTNILAVSIRDPAPRFRFFLVGVVLSRQLVSNATEPICYPFGAIYKSKIGQPSTHPENIKQYSLIRSFVKHFLKINVERAQFSEEIVVKANK